MPSGINMEFEYRVFQHHFMPNGTDIKIEYRVFRDSVAGIDARAYSGSRCAMRLNLSCRGNDVIVSSLVIGFGLDM